MAATLITVLGFFTALGTGISSNAMIVANNVTITITCTAPNVRYPPTWFVNGAAVLTTGDRFRSRIINTGRELTTTLMINGNLICGTLKVHCEVYITEEQQLLSVHNTTLTIHGHLSSPEGVYVNESVNSSTIEWSPPYSAKNNDTICVNPHITHYTVYITDNHTGNSIDRVNVTESQFTFNTQDDSLCPMYQVSAWNAGGEGKLSEPIQESTPQVEYVSVAFSEPDMLHIHIDVNAVCPSRMPKFFNIILKTSAGSVVKETAVQHRTGQAVADFSVSLPQSVDVCTLHVRIRAGNSAGISSPSEAVEVVCSGVSTAPTNTTTSASDDTTVVDDHQKGDNGTLIVILSAVIAVIAAIGGVLIVAATICIICCRKDKLKKNEIEMKPNLAYETVSLPHPSKLATQIHTKPCPAYEVTVQAHH